MNEPEVTESGEVPRESGLPDAEDAALLAKAELGRVIQKTIEKIGLAATRRAALSFCDFGTMEPKLPSQILEERKQDVLRVMERYPRLGNPRVFGSVARGTDKENSDIDFLVDPAPGTTLFDIGGLREDLEELLGVPVDVITSGNHLSSAMRETLAREAVKL